MDFLKLFLSLYVSPVTALSRVIDEGTWLQGAAAVLAVSVLVVFGLAKPLYNTYEAVPLTPQQIRERFSNPPRTGAQTVQTGDSAEAVEPEAASSENDIQQMMELAAQPRAGWLGGLSGALFTRQVPLPLLGNYGWWFISFSTLNVLTTLLALALFYVPGTILLLVWVDYLGSYSVVLRRDYGALLACTLMTWAAAHAPYAVLGLVGFGKLGGVQLLTLWFVAKLTFGVLMICALRTVFGVSVVKAAAVVSVAWVSMLLTSTLVRFATSSLYLMIWLIPLAYGAYAAFGAAHSQQRSFRRSLEAATVNPRDAEAHYQLGLIYQQRRQTSAALERFRKAIEIDARETDAHFQLGIIARLQGRLSDAINHFGTVVAQDEKHAHYEIWREIGATYLAAGMLVEAREALERFVARREFDPEGLFYLGETLEQQGEKAQARELYLRCREAEATMPYHRRRLTRKWGKLARERLASLRG